MLLVGSIVLAPLLLIASYLVHGLRRRRSRYYMTPERDAVLAITATQDGWHADDHVSARPGTGRGQALRAAVIPPLLKIADAQQITLHLTAADGHLAQRYSEEIPGLSDRGPARPRGRQMRREPQF